MSIERGALSIPTRRSSYLRFTHLTADEESAHRHPAAVLHHGDDLDPGEVAGGGGRQLQPVPAVLDAVVPPGPGNLPRWEEHTCELQSRPHLVCRVLLD